MPARWFCVVVFVMWFAAMGWMFTRDWLPWLRATDEAPPFVFELADEVVTQHATWSLTRNGKTMGTARTGLRFLKDNTFEYVNSLSKLEFSIDQFGVQIAGQFPRITTTMIVDPKGQLIRFNTDAELEMTMLQSKFTASMILTGEVVEQHVSGNCTVKSALGQLTSDYGPVPLKSRYVFSPLQPLFRIGGLFPGKRWKLEKFNPVEEATIQAVMQLLKNVTRDEKGRDALPFGLPNRESVALLAEVANEIQILPLKSGDRKCYVIEYRAEQLMARTWVDFEDGTVLRQEAIGDGETLILQRD